MAKGKRKIYRFSMRFNVSKINFIDPVVLRALLHYPAELDPPMMLSRTHRYSVIDFALANHAR